MMADTDLAVERLHELKALGVLLAMDDFGTGYSSLSYLSRFPVDILKMDRSFLSPEHEESGLAAAIIALGNSLDLERRRRGHRAARADRLASRARLRARPGLPVRQADEPRRRWSSTSSAPTDGRLAAVACSIVTRRSTAQAASPASTSSRRSGTATSACSGRDDRLARRRRHLPRRDGLAGLRALERAGRALAARDRHDDPDDRLPAAGGRAQRPARPADAHALRRRRARARHRRARGALR